MNTKQNINDEFSLCLVATNDSNSSRCESNDSIQLPTFDSGNISSSNISDISSLIDFHLYPISMSAAEDGLVTKSIKDSISESDWYSMSKLHAILREKDQSLILAFQDIRKLRSELERLSKSEKWYKAELKSQKSARRELVEKIYLKEREHVQQTQSLHADCTKHQTICNDLKRQLQKEKSFHLKEINKLKCQQEKVPISSMSVDYQNTRNANIIEDQNVTIEVLRNQKQTLLNDLNVLENEKDAKILDLQKEHAELINENRQLTKKCLQLMETRKSLEEKLLNDHDRITNLQELLNLKQQQPMPSALNDLNLSFATSNRFSRTEEILEKENVCLQDKLETLKRENELLHLEHKKLDETAQMELQEKCLENENLQIFQTQNLKHIQHLEQQINGLLDVQHELKNNIELMDAQLKETSSEKEKVTAQSVVIKQLKETIRNLNEQISSQSSDILVLKNFEKEYLNLDEKYNKIYKMCEKSKFELDINAIEVKKLQFERDNSNKEVAKLRERIKKLLVRTQLFDRNATDLEKAKSHLYQLQVTNNDYVIQIRKLKNDLLICNQRNKITANKSLELDETICKLSQELQANECKARQLTTDLATITDCNNALKTGNEQACILETEFKKLTIENKMYEKNLIIAEKEIANYKNQMQEFRKKCTSLRNYIINESYNENEKSCMVSKQRVEALQSLLDQQSSKVTHLNQETNEWTNFLEFVLTAPLFENATSNFYIDHLDTENIGNIVENLRPTEQALQQKIEKLTSEMFRCKQLNKFFHNEVNAAINRERKHFSEFETLITSQIEFLTVDKEKLEQELTEFQNISKNENSNINDDEVCKFLYGVLEGEHKNKINRMELNILALQNNKKLYKNCIKITEEKYSTLVQNCEVTEVDQMRFSKPCEKCETIDFKYQNCLQTITKLQNQLKTERNQFAEIETYKRSNAEMKKRIVKLLCDKKNLIQFIPTSKNYTTNKIDDLIDRSKNSVPNLIKLSKSVDGLKDDIQKLLQTTVSAGRTSPLFIRKKSLMYELKQADADFIPCT